MRRRAIRDLGTLLGIAVILAALVFVNSQVSRGGKRERMEQYRTKIETAREESGVSLLKWDLLKETKGTSSTDRTFTNDLNKLDGTTVNLVGFMTPIDEFQDVEYFMLLPVPIECFFCASPPMREIMYVEMKKGKKADMVNEAVMVTGKLTLNKEHGSQFFYSIKDATWGAGAENSKLTMKNTDAEHQTHMMKGMTDLMKSAPGNAAAPAGS